MFTKNTAKHSANLSLTKNVLAKMIAKKDREMNLSEKKSARCGKMHIGIFYATVIMLAVATTAKLIF